METGNGDFKPTVEGYEVIENLGRGAFGAASLVLHITENKKYVLKKIRLSKQIETEKCRIKTCHEVELLPGMNLIANLRHPYILEYKDVWVNKESCICALTNYCEVGNISHIMRKARRGSYFPEEKLCKWLTQLLLAIDYLHSNRVLHGNLKLSNIFITKENDIHLVPVDDVEFTGDFGLAKLLNEEGLASVARPPNYMCPELLVDTPYCYKSDIWSLAFRAPDMAALINKINRSSISPLPIVYSSNLKQIIKSMLRKSPEHRPTAAELLRHPHLQPYLLRCQNPSTVFLPVKSPSPDNTKGKTVNSSPCCAGGRAREPKDHRERDTKLKQQRELLPLFEENNYMQYPNLLDDDDISIEDHLETKRVDPTSYSGKISTDGEDSKSGETSEIVTDGNHKGSYVISSLKESFLATDASILASDAHGKMKPDNADAESEETTTNVGNLICEAHTTEDTLTIIEGNISIDLTQTEEAKETPVLNQEPSDSASKGNGQQENQRSGKADALESLLELCADLLKRDKFDELNGVLKPFSDDTVSSRETAISLTRSLMNAQKKLAKES
ncbi:hypothetical protein OROGR_006672 [Orobanche gracilis]